MSFKTKEKDIKKDHEVLQEVHNILRMLYEVFLILKTIKNLFF